MKRVYSVFVVLVLVSLLCCPALAVDAGEAPPEDALPPVSEPLPSVVSIDPQSIEDIVGAFDAAQSARDELSASTEPSVPVVEISPDSISALASAIAAASDSAIGDTDISDNPTEKLKDGYYFTCNSVLGDDLTIYVPVEFAVGGFSISDDGRLVNMTMNSFQTRVHVGRKTYIIAAHSMSPFVYWEQKLLGEGEVVQAFDLNETVTDSNMSFLHDTPQAVPDSVFWVVLMSVVMIGFLLVIFVKR